MRSFAEIRFRLTQEVSNLWLFAMPPTTHAETPSPLSGLPDPASCIEALAGTAFAEDTERIAAQILEHRFPLLGLELDLGAEIDWSRDYVHGISNPAPYFRKLPYLDFSRVGDHKIIWEVNRHQHLVLLAQAWLLRRDTVFLDEIVRQLESWWARNPFQRGINWTSALEVAFRAMSWIWVYHLAGSAFQPAFRKRLLTELYRHGRHLHTNLSIYFSPNTHLLGEAVALHAIGALFPQFPESGTWRRIGAEQVSAQMDRQVRDDGSHFEQSTYYHVYSIDFFLLHALLEPVSERYRAKLEKMAGYLRAITYPDGRLPFLGDDDGGRLFHPYGLREDFAHATLATCAVMFGRSDWLRCPTDLYPQGVWWLGPGVSDKARPAPPWQESALFPDAGLAVMTSGATHVLIDGGPFGDGSGGHSHSDTLSLVVRRGSKDVLIDPGTYTYLADPKWRNAFRGSAAHNTVRVNNRDQAVPTNPFRWLEKPLTHIHSWLFTPEMDRFEAQCEYGGVCHRRIVTFLKPHTLIVFDEVKGADGPISAEQFWHPARIDGRVSDWCFDLGAGVSLSLAPPEAPAVTSGGDYGWRSRALGTKEETPLIVVTKQGSAAIAFAAAIRFDAACVDVVVERLASGWRVRWSGGAEENSLEYS